MFRQYVWYRYRKCIHVHLGGHIGRLFWRILRGFPLKLKNVLWKVRFTNYFLKSNQLLVKNSFHIMHIYYVPRIPTKTKAAISLIFILTRLWLESYSGVSDTTDCKDQNGFLAIYSLVSSSIRTLDLVFWQISMVLEFSVAFVFWATRPLINSF